MGWNPDLDAFTIEPEAAFCYVILTMGELRLVIPQHQVYALEPTIDVVYSATNAIGRISVDDAEWPVYCLSDELHLLSAIPDSRRICALLHEASGLFGLLCDQVVLVEWPHGVDVKPLPECMRTPNTILQGLVLQGENVLCVANADGLKQLL